MRNRTLLREKSLAVRFIMNRIAVGDLLVVFSFIVVFVFVVIKVVKRLALGIINNQVLRRLSGGSFNLDGYLTRSVWRRSRHSLAGNIRSRTR